MRRIVLRPKTGQLLMEDAREPRPRTGQALLRTVRTGIDGTDEEVVQGKYGEPPEGQDALTLGHEALGRVVTAPADSGLAEGDLVVPLVRHGCGACSACEMRAPDMCPTDEYVERGIKGLDGFMRDYWADEPIHLVKVPRELEEVAVLTEPLSIVVKAVETARHVQRRIPWFDREGGFENQRALVAGTGSLGSMAAFLLRAEGMDVFAMDRHGHDSPAARLLSRIGVRHVNSKEEYILDVAERVGGFDLVIEATGAPKVGFDLALALSKNGVMAMLGVPGDKPPIEVPADDIMKSLVLGNQVLFGSVNSNRHHFELAIEHLRGFHRLWGDAFRDVVTHRYAPDEYERAFRDGQGVIKKVMEWSNVD